MKFNDRFDSPKTHHAPHVRCKINSAVPGEEGAIDAPDRHAVQAHIGKRNRLYDDLERVPPVLSGGK